MHSVPRSKNSERFVMAGRKTLPTKLKEVKGTARKCRDRKTEAKQSQSGMIPPEWLPVRCNKYFNRIKQMVGELGLDSESYSDVAAIAATRIDEIIACNKEINKNGRVLSEGLSFPRTNPAVTQLNEALRHMQSLLSELGLTASSLGKLAKAPEENKQRGFGGL